MSHFYKGVHFFNKPLWILSFINQALPVTRLTQTGGLMNTSSSRSALNQKLWTTVPFSGSVRETAQLTVEVWHSEQRLNVVDNSLTEQRIIKWSKNTGSQNNSVTATHPSNIYLYVAFYFQCPPVTFLSTPLICFFVYLFIYYYYQLQII